MKKTILSLVFLATTITAWPQLVVDEDGKVFIQMPDENDGAMLNVGEGPYRNDGYYNLGGKVGAHVHSYLSQSGDNYGIVGEAAKNGSTGFAIGVFGFGKGASSNCRNFGVFGTIDINATGGAVCGTTEGGGTTPYNVCNGSYAGYFYGDTYIEGGALTVTDGFYNLSDMSLKTDVVPFSETEGDKGTALDNLQQLDILEYNLKSVRQAKAEQKGLPYEAVLSDQAIKDQKRRHYGLSAQELQKVYPELVRESQEGFLTVNYTELVPILIRSIQELKAELDEVKGAGARCQTRTEETDSYERHSDTFRGSTTSGNVLYQNSPNPFHEQTTIRFRLADDARNAEICIFDMTGKMLRKTPVSPGMDSITINGGEFGEGIYLYSLVVSGQEIDTKRMLITR
jgi:hypothetical protein